MGKGILPGVCRNLVVPRLGLENAISLTAYGFKNEHDFSEARACHWIQCCSFIYQCMGWQRTFCRSFLFIDRPNVSNDICYRAVPNGSFLPQAKNGASCAVYQICFISKHDAHFIASVHSRRDCTSRRPYSTKDISQTRNCSVRTGTCSCRRSDTRRTQ